jgi:hypothetical protein
MTIGKGKRPRDPGLQGVLRGICPAHIGWLAVDEQPVPPEDHRRRIERAIAILRQHVAAEGAAAARALGDERDRLILSATRKEAEIRELREEL